MIYSNPTLEHERLGLNPEILYLKGYESEYRSKFHNKI